MRNGRYKLKEGDVVGEVEIVVAGDRVTCVLSKDNDFWVVGEECDEVDMIPNCWELISKDEKDTPSFRIGDKVKRKDGTPFSNGKLVATVGEVSCELGDVKVWLKETSKWCSPDSIELAVEDIPTPHKYADVIKAWADGYDVQYFQMGYWVDQDWPSFDPDLEWRVKPKNPPQDRISEIENTIAELQNELEELKGS